MGLFRIVQNGLALSVLAGFLIAGGPVMGGPAKGTRAETGNPVASHQRLDICNGTKIEITTDEYPEETTWELRDHFTHELVDEGDAPVFNGPNTYCHEGIGCFDFTILDRHGDGICCGYGEGHYEVYYLEVLVGEGGEFGGSETVTGIGECAVYDFSVTAPGSWSGDTCGVGNNCTLRPSEDVTYEVDIPIDGTWTFSLCDSEFDTYLFLGTSSCGSEVDSDDDTCAPASEITANLLAGTYYATVESFYSDKCGAYTLAVTGECVCGDGTCDAGCGEHCGTCPEDCGACECVCATTVDTFPNCTGFESDLGDWNQGEGDDIDWTRWTGQTDTSFTGPSAAHGGDYYVYTEASPSGVGNPFKNAFLEACFDFSSLSSPQLDFWYNMNGLNIGTLRVEVSEDACAHWTEVWSLSDNQFDNWYEAQVDLSDYEGSTVTIRFTGTTGDGVQGDMAIDDVCVDGESTLCPDGSTMNFAESGMIDAGEPYGIDNATEPEGYSTFFASGPAGATDPSCWRFSETDAGSCRNAIANVVETSSGNYEITLGHPLQSGSTTTITYDWGAGNHSGVYTALPGDANSGGQTGPADLGALIECLQNGTCSPWQCDVDRLGRCTAADLGRLVDLLNPGGEFTSWNGATPAVENCP